MKLDHDLGEPVLCCANCGQPNLHGEETHLHAREEDEDGQYIVVNNRKGLVGNRSDVDPKLSPRRDGLAIRFSCEHCKEITVLHIYQHKGNTFINTSVALA